MLVVLGPLSDDVHEEPNHDDSLMVLVWLFDDDSNASRLYLHDGVVAEEGVDTRDERLERPISHFIHHNVALLLENKQELVLDNARRLGMEPNQRDSPLLDARIAPISGQCWETQAGPKGLRDDSLVE